MKSIAPRWPAVPQTIAHKGVDGLAMAESGRLGNSPSPIDTEADTFFWRYYVLKNTPFSDKRN